MQVQERLAEAGAVLCWLVPEQEQQVEAGALSCWLVLVLARVPEAEAGCTGSRDQWHSWEMCRSCCVHKSCRAVSCKL